MCSLRHGAKIALKHAQKRIHNKKYSIVKSLGLDLTEGEYCFVGTPRGGIPTGTWRISYHIVGGTHGNNSRFVRRIPRWE